MKMNKKTRSFPGPVTAGAVLGTLAGIYLYFLPPVRKMKHHTYPFGLLLGCAAREDGTPSGSLQKRCDLAIRQWKQGAFKTLVVSGGAVKNEFRECDVMADYIRQKADIPLLKEPLARNTWQNLENTRNMIGDQPLLIMTGSLHARRASSMASNFFSDFALASYPDRRLKHIIREAVSRLIFIRLEMGKLFKKS